MSKNAGTSSPRRSKSSSAEPGARALAAHVLGRVWQGEAFAAAALDADLRRHPQTDPRDVALATELVYGVLRLEPVLEGRVDEHAGNPKWKKQPWVRAHLLIAAYSMLVLDRIPDHSAVDEAVEAIKNSRDRRVAGFANAVLRKLARGERIDPAEAAVASLPRWLRAALARSVGEDEVRALLASSAPTTSLCLRRGEDRERWLERLQATAPGARWEPGSLSPRCIRGWNTGDPARLEGFGRSWIVQEEGAQAVALLFGARPGEAVLDACAGRGGKTLLLSEAVGEAGAVDAADLHPRKLARLREQPGGDAVRATFSVDWTRGAGGVDRRYDRILVDAPCTGSGTLHRRPEILGRLRRSDPGRMAALQQAIVGRVSELLRPGGRLVYAVCSLLCDEAEGVVEAVSAEGRLRACPFEGPLGEGKTQLRLLPSRHGCDGFFVACFERGS